MGMPFRQSHARPTPGTVNQQVDWFPELDRESVTITLDADQLQRLLSKRLLYVEDFSCADESSRASVRRMLLRVLSQATNPG